MKIIKQLSIAIIIGLALVGCTSTESFREIGGVPYKVEKNRVEEGDYTLDNSFFRKRGITYTKCF